MKASVLVLATAMLVGQAAAFSFNRPGRGGFLKPRMPSFGKPKGGRSSSGSDMFGGRGGGIGSTPGEPEPEPEQPKEDPAGLGAVWASYIKVLDEKPILTKACTSFFGFLIGDVLAQCFVEKKDEYDIYRTIRLASFGFLIHGTTGHWFYGLLDRKVPGKDAFSVFGKVAFDQVFWNPIFGVMFFGYMGLLEGSGVSGTIHKIKSDLLTQVTGSWTVWPAAHAVSFRFVPTKQRLLFINTIQIFYNVFLSIVGNKTKGPVVVEPANAIEPHSEAPVATEVQGAGSPALALA